MFDTAIRGGKVVSASNIKKSDIYIKDGKIAALTSPGAAFEAQEVIDAQGMLVFPGAIDIHAHLRAGFYPARRFRAWQRSRCHSWYNHAVRYAVAK